MPLEREVVLEFEHFSSFIREYSANISLGGMFVKTDEPQLPDTVFRFEVRLAADAPLIAGLAKVLWVRGTADGDDLPTGMGVRFLQLEERGRDLIEQIVREHLARGGRPFELDQAGEAETGPQTPVASAAVEAVPPPIDRSSVIELPPLEDLLESAREPEGKVAMDTPPRGWKPGISVARPQTRPQLIAVIGVGAAIVAAAVYFLVRLFATQPVLDEAETAPPELPRALASAEEAAAEPLQPFTAVEEITWQRAGNGAEIVVRLDGSLPEGSWSVVRISDPPRHLLKFVGASRPYPTDTFEVGFGGVHQLRTGFHDGGAGNEQHVVIDLVDPRVVLEEVETEGATVRLRFRRLS
jgi:type IV pilus assembly protein PilZ